MVGVAHPHDKEGAPELHILCHVAPGAVAIVLKAKNLRRVGQPTLLSAIMHTCTMDSAFCAAIHGGDGRAL
jgi:hypothetical protein